MDYLCGPVRHAAHIEDAAMVGLAHKTDEGGNVEYRACVHRNIAQKSQSIASGVIEPVFAAGRILDPLRVIAPGKVGGRLPHPRQTRGA